MNQVNTSSEPNKNNIRGDGFLLKRVALFFALAILGVVADLWTKSYMFATYFDPELAHLHHPQAPHWVVDGIFGFQTSTNPGALFGIGSGLSWLFAGLSVVALIGILVWLFFFKGFHERLLTFALGLITGGILGNLYDRLGLGYLPEYPEEIKTNVRDWVLFRLQGVPMFDPWPNFNIADSLLVTGAILLFINALFFVEEPSATENKKTDDA